MTTLDEFAQRFTDAVADSDYSRYPQLQALSGQDIRAAADALWTKAVRTGLDLEHVTDGLDETAVVKTLTGLRERYDDANHLVSVRFERYWDETSLFIKSDQVRSAMEANLCSSYLTDRRAEPGTFVVDNAYGIWVFEL